MAVLGIKYAEFDGGMLYKGDLKGNPQKIVIHNSASAGSAYATARWNREKTISGENRAFAHYYVDNENVIQLAKDTWVGWHSGVNSFNNTTIGVEICVNPMLCYNRCKQHTCDKITTLCVQQKDAIQRFFDAEKVAIDLVYTLLAKWNLTEDDVVFHSDLKATACPFFTKKLHNLAKAKDFLTIFGS